MKLLLHKLRIVRPEIATFLIAFLSTAALMVAQFYCHDGVYSRSDTASNGGMTGQASYFSWNTESELPSSEKNEVP